MSSTRSRGPSSSVLQRLRGWVIALGAAALLAGCAQLPTDVERPVSTALASPAGTALDALVRERREANGGRAASGFLLLPTPQSAYGSRLALVEAAQKTLDLQYYAIHADASSERLLRAVAAAAKRGVRVRILLDDFHGTGRNALVMRMGFEPNIEMRMFNPLAGARGSTVFRMVNAVGDFNRAQQRMHNKLFIADNAMGVTGGRNLGDAYFGIAQTRNFVDLDVLAAGPIVRELSSSFDHYWNNERAYPVQSLVTREELRDIRDETRTAEVSRDGKANRSAGSSEPEAPIRTGDARDATRTASGTVGDGGRLPDGEPRPTEAGPTDAQRVAAWDQQPLDLRRANFVWAPAAMMVDKPAKIPSDAAEAMDNVPAGAPPTPGLVVTRLDPVPAAAAGQDAPGRRAAGLVAATEIASDAETVVDGLLNLIAQSREELLIISPYFVPGPDMLAAFATARERGVRIRVLTNSLASNDAPVAHVGYARHREKLLALGVELYELRSEPSGLGGALGSSGASGASGSAGSTGASGPGTSRAMLHSKVLVMDKRLAVIGSMNLDQRSQLQNTEIALLVRSAVLSQQIAAEIDPTMTHGAWHVELVDGKLLWRAPQDSGVPDTTTEPDTSVGLRVLLRLVGPFVPEELL